MFGAICCSFVSWAQRWCVPNTLWIMGRVWSVKPDPWHRMININPLPSAHTHPHISHSLKLVLRGGGWFLGQVLNQSDLLRLEWSMKATDWSHPVYLLQLTVCDGRMKDSLRLNEWMRWVAVSLKVADLWPTRRMLLQSNATSLGSVLLKNACSTGLGSNNEY